ncbi:ADP-ribosyltransferase, partial [Coprobacillus cateniformis]
DFKGTHVYHRILLNRFFKVSNSKGYAIILIPKGSPVAYISDISWFVLFRNEKELLIDRNQQFRLIDTFNILNSNGYVFKLENNLLIQ